MITENKGMFLTIPTALGLDMNYCSHACGYCFANNNKPDRQLLMEKTFNTLKNFEKNKSLVAFYLQNRFPILASNTVDIFAKSNYKHFLELYSIIKDKQIPLYIQTRGGKGVDEVLKTLPKSAVYVSITSHDEKIIKKIEPGCPTPNERIELVKKLHKLGHNVAVGINPYMPNYCDAEWIIQQTRDYTDKYWINELHINNNQLRNVTDRMKKIIKDEIKFCKEDNSLAKLYDLCIEYAIVPGGIYKPSLSNFWNIFDCYENKLPTSYDFVKHIINTKKEHCEIYFDEFKDFILSRIPKGINSFDSGYIVSIKRDYSNLKARYSVEEVVRFIWNNWKLAQSAPLHTQSLFPTKRVDDNSNVIYQYTFKPFINS